MVFIHDLIAQLQRKLGHEWQLRAVNDTLWTIVSPYTNEIGDNFEVEIENKLDHYEIDDNCDALNEFDLYQLPKTKAYQYLKTVSVNIDPQDGALIIKSDRDHVFENIQKLIQIQIDINQIQQQVSRNLGHK